MDVRINILWLLLPVFAVLIDSCVVITVGLHLKKTAKAAVLEAAADVQKAMLTNLVPMIGPLLAKYTVNIHSKNGKESEPSVLE